MWFIMSMIRRRRGIGDREEGIEGVKREFSQSRKERQKGNFWD